jgi:hypothetical protein
MGGPALVDDLAASRALIEVSSLDEPREFVHSWRLVSLPDSAARDLHEARATLRKPTLISRRRHDRA